VGYATSRTDREEAMTTHALVIDCDGHILEPPDLWEAYLEPEYRDRALRIRVGDDGFEQLLIDGRPSTIARPGQLSTLGGMGKRVDEARELRERAMRGDVAPDQVRGIRPTPEQTYLGGAAFGTMDMKERLQLLDREGLAKAVLYPTLGLLWEAELFDADLSSAYCRAYNRWIADFCRDSGGRLISHRASLTRRSARRRARAGARGERRVPRRLRLSVHDYAGAPRRPTPRPGLRRRAGPRCAAGRASDLRAARVQCAPPLRQVRLGRLVLQSLRGAGGAAGVRHVLPAGCLRALPAPARGRAGVPGRLDRLLPRSGGRDLHRDAARRDRAAEGKAVVLLQATV